MLEWFQQIDWAGLGMGTLGIVGHVVCWLLIIVGFAGTFLPFLPGPFMILAGAVVHRLWLGPEYSVGWPGLVALTILFLLTVAVEYASGAMGARWFGSSKWGMWGAIAGGIVGIFFGLPGLILGPLIGVFLFELAFDQKEVKPAARSTWGTLVGTAAGMAIKGVIAGAMVVWILVDVILGPKPLTETPPVIEDQKSEAQLQGLDPDTA